MTEHVSDELPRLLTGDATREEVLHAAQHLRDCPDCQQEMVAAVVAHASLSSARRFAPGVVEARDAPTDDDVELPDLSPVFERARTEAAGAGRRARRRRLLAVAAAVVVATAGGVTIAAVVGSHTSRSSGRTVELAAYGVGTQGAQATLDRSGTMHINAAALPALGPSQFYEVWLTDAARQHMQAVGSIGAGNRAVLTVSPPVMAHYTAIEVSVQRVGQTAYSGTSVLRGSYG